MSSKRYVLARRLLVLGALSYMRRVYVIICSHSFLDHVSLSQAYGEAGVIKVVQILEREIVTGMRLLGVSSISDLKPELVRGPPLCLGDG